MTNENLELLEEALNTLMTEQRELYALWKQDIFTIEETDNYLKDLSRTEEDNFRVFSPRSVESVYKEQIENEMRKKNTYEKEKTFHETKLAVLNGLIDKIKTVIENLNEFPD